MRFAFSSDQLAFRDAVRDLLAKECPAEVVRAAWPELGGGAGPRASTDDVRGAWVALADMGVLGIAVPEQLGGLGLGELDWVLLAEETGYAALPHPFVETVGIAGPLFAELGDPTGQLAGLLSGDLVVTAQFDGSTLLPFGQSADVLLARHEGGLYGLGRDDIDSAPVDSVDGSRRLARLTCAPEQGPLLLADDDVIDGWFDRGALGTAAQLIGLGRRMLDLTVALRQGTTAVRRADRQLPGGQAPPGRCRPAADVRSACRLPGRALPVDRCIDRRARRVDGEGDGL